MAEFIADIAGMLEIFAIATGFLLLHRANKEAPAPLIKVAAWVLLAGGVAVGACTSYYWFIYRAQGGFDSMHMAHPMMMQGQGMMGPGMMGPGMTSPGTMPHGVTPPAPPPDPN